MTTPILTRPLFAQRSPLILIIAGLAMSGLIALGIFAGCTALAERETTVVVQPVPVEIALSVPAPAPTPPPASTPALAPVPVPTPGPAVVEEPPPRPRTLAPYLNAMCLLAEPGFHLQQCDWDDGFPAISDDGTTIAVKSIGERSVSGGPDIEILFLDARTGRLQRRESIINEPTSMPATSAEVAAAAKRLAAVQRTLEARSFRALTHLNVRNLEKDDLGHQEPPPDGDEVYAERDYDMVRLIDPQTNTMIAQRDFSVPSPPENANGECNAWFLRAFEAWWDPATKTLLGQSGYTKGGCMCGFEVHRHVFRVP